MWSGYWLERVTLSARFTARSRVARARSRTYRVELYTVSELGSHLTDSALFGLVVCDVCATFHSRVYSLGWRERKICLLLDLELLETRCSIGIEITDELYTHPVGYFSSMRSNSIIGDENCFFFLIEVTREDNAIMYFHSEHVLTYIYVDNYRKQKVHAATFMQLIKWVRPMWVVPYHVAFIILICKDFKMSLHVS